MSYILDALRKSEADRQRGEAPDVTTDHGMAPSTNSTGAGNRATRWLTAAILLNAAVLGAWLLWPEAPMVVPSGAQTAPGEHRTATPGADGDVGVLTDPGAAAATGAAPNPDTDMNQDISADTIPAGVPGAFRTGTRAGTSAATTQATMSPPTSATESGLASAARSSPAGGAAAPSATAAQSGPPIAAAATTGLGVAATPMSIRDLPDRIQRSIPDLAFSTHIHADNPDFREVGINGGRFAEGDRIEGMLLYEITEDGVVFDHQGYLFEMSVLQDWDY